MMRRGMVIKLNNDYAIIATNNSHFIKIKNKEGMQVGQKIFFFDEDIISLKEDNKKNSSMPNYFKVVAVLAACIVIAVMMNNPFVRDTQPLYAMVSLDVNPSFELGIDEAFNVVQINAMNEESKEILDIELMGKPLYIAVSKILSDIEASGYALASDNAILVSTVNFKNDNNEPLQKIVAEGVCLAMSENPVYKSAKVIFIDADKEDLEAAEEEKLSIGKYQLLEMSDDKIDKTTISEGKVSELIEEEEIKDDFEKDKKIQIMDGEDLQRLNRMEKEIDSLKDTVNQIKGALNNYEVERIGDLVDDIEKMDNKLINEDSEFEEIYEIIEALYEVIELEEDEELDDSYDEDEELEDEELDEPNDDEKLEAEELDEPNDDDEKLEAEELDDPYEEDEELEAEELDDPYDDEDLEAEKLDDSYEEDEELEDEELDDSYDEDEELEDEELDDSYDEDEEFEDEELDDSFDEDKELEDVELDDL